MKIRILPLFIVLILPIGLAGCQTVQPIPSNITLRDALIQIREGIQELQVRPVDSKPAGLLVSEVNVTFNITASKKDSAKLGVDLAVGGALPTGKVEIGTEAERGRSNQITFKFQNLYLAPKDTLVGISITPISTDKAHTVSQPMTLENLYKLIDESSVISR